MRGPERARRVLARLATTARRAPLPDGYHDAVVRLLFDEAHYRAQGAKRFADPLADYLRAGWRVGLDPHPLFSSSFYLDDNPDVADADMCPLVHYTRFGAGEGRRPHPLFDPGYYRDRYVDVSDPSIDALAHFIRFGGEEGRDPNPWFDTAFYMRRVSTRMNPLQHYATVGWREGHDPHPDFDVAFYQATNPELGGSEPLSHYLTTGLRAGREPCPDFALRLLARRNGIAPVASCRLVVLTEDDGSPTELREVCSIIDVTSPAQYEPLPGDYVYAPDRPSAALSPTHLVNVAVCLAHQSYDFVVVSQDRSNGSLVTAASADNAVVLSADAYLRRRVGRPPQRGSVGRFVRLSRAPRGDLSAILIDQLGLGTLMRFGAELVVAGESVVLPPIVARRSPARPVLSVGGSFILELAELGPPDLHEAMRRAIS